MTWPLVSTSHFFTPPANANRLPPSSPSPELPMYTVPSGPIAGDDVTEEPTPTDHATVGD